MAEAGGMQIKQGDEFTKIVKDVGDKLVVVDFYASWCTPCQRIVPDLQEIQDQFPDVTFFKVDIDENIEAAGTFNIQSVPTFVLMKRAKELDRIQGAYPEDLRELILKHINASSFK